MSLRKLRNIQEANRSLERRQILENPNLPKPLLSEQGGLWDNISSILFGAGKAIYNYLIPDYQKDALKVLIDFTPIGVLKNMAIAASNGDAQNFSQAWDAAQKYTKQDLSQLKKTAFNNMKSFGGLLTQAGIK